MSAHLRPPRRAASLLLAVGVLSISRADAAAAETRGYTIVSAHAYQGYARTSLADGSFQPETYAFGNGGKWEIAMSDPSIDDLDFKSIARTIAVPLAEQNYVPSKDPNQTNLLIVVYWGTTSGSAEGANFGTTPGHVVFGGGISELVDVRNARLLGFDFPSNAGANPFMFDRDAVLQEIEANRYFVGLVAYDFQLLWKHKVRKVLWVTRYSIREHRNQFDVDLPEITHYASQFFGQESHGFVVKRLQDGHVDVGTPKVVGSGEVP